MHKMHLFRSEYKLLLKIVAMIISKQQQKLLVSMELGWAVLFGMFTTSRIACLYGAGLECRV